MKNEQNKRFRPGASDPLTVAVTQRDRDIVSMVADAIATNHTRLAFQPVIVARDGGRVGFYEGLIRVMDATGRIIQAGDFMPQVEKTELGREIDVLALHKGLKALHAHPNIRLSINMSARSIGYTKWMRALRRWLDRDPTIGERLILEITETSAMDQPEVTVDFMNQLSRYGICFAIDDFGAGHTALRYFKEFYFDVMKVDGSFCRDISQDPDNRALVRAMISIAHHFDMLTIAEGVENAADADCLSELGFDCLQGYYFGAPTLTPPWNEGTASGDSLFPKPAAA